MKAPLKLKILDGKVSEYLSELGKVFFAAKAYAERLKEVPVHNGEQPYAVIAQIFVLLRRGNKADGGACGDECAVRLPCIGKAALSGAYVERCAGVERVFDAVSAAEEHHALTLELPEAHCGAGAQRMTRRNGREIPVLVQRIAAEFAVLYVVGIYQRVKMRYIRKLAAVKPALQIEFRLRMPPRGLRVCP